MKGKGKKVEENARKEERTAKCYNGSAEEDKKGRTILRAWRGGPGGREPGEGEKGWGNQREENGGRSQVKDEKRMWRRLW